MTIYVFGDVSLDVSALRLTVNGELRQLEPKSFRLLQFLIENRQRVVSKEEILTAVWEGTAVSDNALTRAVAQIRKALDDDPKQPRYIETVQTVGYRFLANVDAAPAPASVPALVPPPARPRHVAWAVAAVFAVLAAALGFVHFRESKAPAAEPLHFRINLPPGVTFAPTGHVTLSPDGRRVAFAARGGGQFLIWVQDLTTGIARPLPDTDTSPRPTPPFWSPDSRYVVFLTQNKLRKADLERGVSEDICDRPGAPVGGDWNRDGVIIFGSNNSGLWRVPATGGTPVPLTTLDPSRGEVDHELPVFLPDGVHFLYLSVLKDPSQNAIYAGSLKAPTGEKPKKVVATPLGARFIPASGGEPARLLYFTGQTPQVQEFDPASLELRGRPRALPLRAGSAFQTPYLSAGPNLLVYRPAGDPSSQRFVWQDLLTGKMLETLGEAGDVSLFLRISPDGSRVAFARKSDIWILDIARGVSSRVTFGNGESSHPAWSPDGREIAWASFRGPLRQILVRRADGTGEPRVLVQSSDFIAPYSISPDNKALFYESDRFAAFGSSDIWVQPLSGGNGEIKPDGKAFAFAKSSFGEFDPAVSPDGRWVVYTSNETGREEVYVRPFPGSAGDDGGNNGGDGKWMISKHGGHLPAWRADGKELMWVEVGRGMAAADVETSHGFRAGTPHALAPFPPRAVTGAPAQDFKRSLLVVADAPDLQAEGPQFLDVIVNWSSLAGR